MSVHNNSPHLLVIGELNMDLILNGTQSFPELGKEKIAGDFDLTLGSSSAICLYSFWSILVVMFHKWKTFCFSPDHLSLSANFGKCFCR